VNSCGRHCVGTHTIYEYACSNLVWKNHCSKSFHGPSLPRRKSGSAGMAAFAYLSSCPISREMERRSPSLTIALR
jgi:hypothetical protein